MKKVSVFLVILPCFAVGTLAQFSSSSFQRGRFNITLNELEEQCNYNAGTLGFDNILRNLQSFRNFRSSLLSHLNAATIGSPAQGDNTSIFVINQICGTNQEVINTLRQLVENVQSCLNEERRLNKGGLQKVLDNMLNGVCLQLEFERALSTQPQCLDELMSSLHSPTDECALLFPRYKSVYTLEPIPIVYSYEECSDFISVANCRFSRRQNCDADLKAIIKHRFDSALGLIFCDNTPFFN